jgi:yecA family protein
MPIDRLHGYLCAVYRSPELIRPSTWLPLVWGDDPPEFTTDSVAERAIDGVFHLAQEIANALAEASFEPLLPRRPGPGMDNVAQAWCEGFVDGMALDDDAWHPLVEDPSANRLLTPIFALALADIFDHDPIPDPAATANLVAMLSTVVPLIPEYWNDAAYEANPETAPRVRSARTVRQVRTRRRARTDGANTATTPRNVDRV